MHYFHIPNLLMIIIDMTKIIAYGATPRIRTLCHLIRLYARTELTEIFRTVNRIHAHNI